MRTSAHGHPHHDIRALHDGILRHEGEAEPGRDHGKNPVVAVAAIYSFDLGAVLGKNIARNVRLLAIDAVEVTLAVEITDADFVSVGQPVPATEHDEELLPEERKIMKPLIDQINCRLQSAFEQAALKRESGRILSVRTLRGLPQESQVTRHVWVEGWSMIGKWTGVPFRTFLQRIGADLTTKYVGFRMEPPGHLIICKNISGKLALVTRATAREDRSFECVPLLSKELAP